MASRGVSRGSGDPMIDERDERETRFISMRESHIAARKYGASEGRSVVA